MNPSTAKSDQWLDHIRDQVRAAFNGPDSRAPSPLGDMFTRESKELTKPRVKVPEPPPGLTATERRAWRKQWLDEYKNTRWNCAVWASESRRPGRSMPIDYYFPDGWILRKMSNMAPEHRRILRMLYKENEPRSQHIDWLRWHLWGKYEMDGLNSKTRNVIAAMIGVQLSRFGDAYGWRGIMSEPWELFELGRDAWRKTYAAHWRNIADMLVELDEAALWELYA